MASRVAYPGVEAALDALTTTNFDRLPGGLIGYASVTADQTNIGNGSDVDLTSLTVNVTANSGRLFRVWGHTAFILGAGSAATIHAKVKESSTVFGEYGSGEGSVPAATGSTMDGFVLVTAPSSGSHTYKLAVQFNANTNNLMRASSTQPAWIGVEDMGITF